jgi:hypothetical protein
MLPRGRGDTDSNIATEHLFTKLDYLLLES